MENKLRMNLYVALNKLFYCIELWLSISEDRSEANGDKVAFSNIKNQRTLNLKKDAWKIQEDGLLKMWPAVLQQSLLVDLALDSARKAIEI